MQEESDWHKAGSWLRRLQVEADGDAALWMVAVQTLPRRAVLTWSPPPKKKAVFTV